MHVRFQLLIGQNVNCNRAVFFCLSLSGGVVTACIVGHPLSRAAHLVDLCTVIIQQQQ